MFSNYEELSCTTCGSLFLGRRPVEIDDVLCPACLEKKTTPIFIDKDLVPITVDEECINGRGDEENED